MYKLQDLKGEDLTGIYHEDELSPYDETDETTYEVEKVLGKKTVKGKKFVLVKYKGYEKKIIKMKRKRKAVKVAFVFCISLSVVSSTVCASLTVLIPPVAICIPTAGGAPAAAVSLKFNLKDKNGVKLCYL